MVAKVASATLLGLDAVHVTVEVDVSNGLPGLTIVGLPDKSVEESRERVRSAIRASGSIVPPQRVTVNLSPADIRKEGPMFDLPIALGVLAAGEQVRIPPSCWFFGELSLDGTLQPVRGILAMAAEAKAKGVKELIVPPGNCAEAGIVELTVRGPKTLKELMHHLKGERTLPRFRADRESPEVSISDPDLADVKGQAHAKRVMEISAAGGHNVLMSGPPGTGKTMLAEALAGIMPPLSSSESLEVTKIYSVAGLLAPDSPVITSRPFRRPHHSISLAGLIGGGSWPRPGEMSLAHKGVLFLDETPQFPRHVLEAIRGPLEDRAVRISRAQHTLWFPTDCLLIGSMNPCPCGFRDDPVRRCVCSPGAIEQYARRLSGPIRDRFDLTVDVPRLPYAELTADRPEPSSAVGQRVRTARRLQVERFGSDGLTNAAIRPGQLEEACPLDSEATKLLSRAVDQWHLSVRGCHRLLKVARTIADLAGGGDITERSMAEALQYRSENVKA